MHEVRKMTFPSEPFKRSQPTALDIFSKDEVGAFRAGPVFTPDRRIDSPDPPPGGRTSLVDCHIAPLDLRPRVCRYRFPRRTVPLVPTPHPPPATRPPDPTPFARPWVSFAPAGGIGGAAEEFGSLAFVPLPFLLR